MAVSANCARDQSIKEVSNCCIYKCVVRVSRWGSGCGAVDEFFGDILPALALRVEAAQEAGEEDHAQHDEHDDQLHQDQNPQRTPPGHLPEAVDVEACDTHQGVAGAVVLDFHLFLFVPNTISIGCESKPFPLSAKHVADDASLYPSTSIAPSDGLDLPHEPPFIRFDSLDSPRPTPARSSARITMPCPIRGRASAPIPMPCRGSFYTMNGISKRIYALFMAQPSNKKMYDACL